MADALVLDASALVKLVLDEAESEAFRRWYDEQAATEVPFLAPDLIGYEMAHVVARHLPGLTPAQHRTSVLEALDGIDLRSAFADVGPFLRDATAYDAAYLAVAAASSGRLVTYDEDLQRAARRHGIPTLAPS